MQVSGINPAYRWYKQDLLIAGATNSTFTLPKAKVSDGGNYYVVVSNQVNSVTSAVVTVTVPSYVMVPIGPAGSIYTGVSASSQYPDPNYVGANLFDSDLTGVAIIQANLTAIQVRTQLNDEMHIHALALAGLERSTAGAFRIYPIPAAPTAMPK